MSLLAVDIPPPIIFALPPDPDLVSRFKDAGVDRVIFFFAPENADATRKKMDECKAFID